MFLVTFQISPDLPEEIWYKFRWEDTFENKDDLIPLAASAKSAETAIAGSNDVDVAAQLAEELLQELRESRVSQSQNAGARARSLGETVLPCCVAHIVPRSCDRCDAQFGVALHSSLLFHYSSFLNVLEVLLSC